MNIAIIPARSGSKRIPQKNIKNFLGKPMLAYAIEAAQQSKIFDFIMVSTDSQEIADIAVSHGAKVPFLRSSKNSSDYATTFNVLDEVISEYKKIHITFSSFCCIYPCVPFLTGKTLQEAFSHLSHYDAVIPVIKYPVPIEWALKIENNILTPHNLEMLNIRSQDLTPTYYDAGMFYFCKTEKLYENNSLLPERTYGLIIPETEAQDIDTPEDWNSAELKYRLLHNK